MIRFHILNDTDLEAYFAMTSTFSQLISDIALIIYFKNAFEKMLR